jgi:transcriptional regulator with XRE-family HTH domain
MYFVKIIFIDIGIFTGYIGAMKKINYSKIAKQAGISRQFLCNILAQRKRPAWEKAKRLAEVTHTDPILWLEGTPDEIKRAIASKAESE